MEEKDFAAHLREHKLMSDAHREDHAKLAGELKDTANELALAVRETAARLADNLRTTADTHWLNHQREHELSERAVDKAERAVNERLAGITSMMAKNKEEGNEWRGAMDDREGKFASKEQLATAEKAINSLDQSRVRIEGKQSGAAPMWAITLTVVTAVIVLIITRFINLGGN